MSDAIDRAAKVIADFNACGHCEGTCGTCRGEAEALADAGLFASPAHDRAVAARALRDAADVLDEEDPSMKYPVDPETVRIIRMLRARADRIERGEQ